MSYIEYTARVIFDDESFREYCADHNVKYSDAEFYAWHLQDCVEVLADIDVDSIEWRVVED